MAKKPESPLQLSIRKRLQRDFPSLWKKIHGGPFQDAGISDLLGCVCGLYIALEVKIPGEEPTKLQLDFIEDVKEAGGYGAVVESEEEAVNFVRYALARATSRSGFRNFQNRVRAVLRATDGEDADNLKSNSAIRPKVRSTRRPKNQ